VVSLVVNATYVIDTPPNFLRNPNVGLRMKQRKKKRIRAHSLACNTLGVGGHVKAPKWD
jgi:hypothetical protein